MYGGLDSSLWSGKQDRLIGSACPWIERIGSTEPGKLVITKLIIIIELGHFGWRDAVVISAANSQIRRSSSRGRMGLVERTTTSRWEATYLEKPLSHFWIVSRFPGTMQSSKYSSPGRHVNVLHVLLSNSDLHCSTIQVLQKNETKESLINRATLIYLNL